MGSRFAFLAIGAALLAAGCNSDPGAYVHYGTPDGSGGSGRDGSGRPPRRTDYQIASCRYTLQEGGQTMPAGAPDYRRFLFDKQLDYSKLRAVSRASASATLEFIQREGVQVYGAHDAASGTCPMFDGLTEAPSDLKAPFKTSDGDTSFTVGVFFAKDSKDVASSSAGPVIGLRRDANRWTLVHEFSHYLFDAEVMRSGGEHTDAVKRRFSEAADAYKTSDLLYRAIRNERNFNKESEDLLRAWTAAREIVLSFFAEEMTIETLMRQRMEAGELQFVPYEKKSSSYYIASSGEKGLKVLKKFESELSHLITEATSRNYNANLSKLTSARSDLNTLSSKMLDIALEAASQYDNAADFRDTTEHVQTICPREREAEELLGGLTLGAE